ncbi:hypothetical protein ACIOEW_17995 [Streptomyces sp. NPDC087901]|uniref:hypothetical protein n=1 Tax=Streptomyces sp. NPDC087901 TaxID=3365818 RepID=UPI00381B97E2
MTVVAAAAAGLVFANAGWAVADSGGYDGDHGRSGNSGVACVAGKDARFSNNCGNTNIYRPNILILDNLLNLLSPPTTGGGGGNN